MNEGHNSNAQLRSIIERVENLEADKAQIASDIKDIYEEAKSNGFDVKALRAIVRRRKQDKGELARHEALVETYMHALGMLADLPLGQAAVERAAKALLDTGAKVSVSYADAPFHAPEAPEVA